MANSKLPIPLEYAAVQKRLFGWRCVIVQASVAVLIVFGLILLGAVIADDDKRVGTMAGAALGILAILAKRLRTKPGSLRAS